MVLTDRYGAWDGPLSVCVCTSTNSKCLYGENSKTGSVKVPVKILRPLRGRKSDFYAQKALLRGPQKWRLGAVKVTFPLRIFAGINI